MDKEQRRARAIKKVKRIKKFHNHLRTYLVVNIGILFLRFTGLGFVGNAIDNTSTHKLISWIDWNVVAIPLFWGIGLLMHAAKTYGWLPFFGDKWEERKIKEFMEKDRLDN
ncbi:Histidine kinase [Croceitalea dokdonensis DOKDO 023]|uniref:Histidine kinase n=1 Tax=Croceitalea dokdonensis DOKDO 023 TaxID=1300341 RepID=A0A0P7B1Q3_9FLAO|nr:2TM domain-containing protein [Croceitalea dokdonensis]KPM33109.1 Histidine kinase [Croceitalea dokdonensis DOKDO 023]